MFVVGVTGGIGTGKSEIARILGKLGAVLIDADQLGHEAYKPKTATWIKVVGTFGSGILQSDDYIDRKGLGAIVFNNATEMTKLNTIMWPAIGQMIRDRLGQFESTGSSVVVLEAAVMIEAGWGSLVDEVWVSVAPEEVVVERLRARNGLSQAAAQERIRAQMPQTERTRHAQVVIENHGGLDELEKQLQDLWVSRVKISG